jgi:transcriptional regulator with XRE-family HTH domain
VSAWPNYIEDQDVHCVPFETFVSITAFAAPIDSKYRVKRQARCLFVARTGHQNIYFTVFPIFGKVYVMTKASTALSQMPPSTLAALAHLGADLAVARLRRKESLKTWAKRLGVSVPTLLRLEAGEPSVSVGVLATALWLIGRDTALGTLATPKEDRGALELDVRQAETLGKQRVLATAQAKLQRAAQRQGRKPPVRQS